MTLRSIVAVVLGFTFAVAMCGLCAVLGPSDAQTDWAAGLLLLIPIWVAAGALAFVSVSTKRACAWLLTVNIFGYALLWTATTTGLFRA